jgi:hypothetical protein
MRRLVSIALLLALGGCHDVLSSRPMGETEVALVPEEWDGVWFTPDDEFAVFRVVEPERTSIEAWFLERDSDGTPTLEPATLLARESGAWLFLSMLKASEEPPGPPEYYWVRAKKDDDTLILWIPDSGKFEKLVAEGVFPGSAESSDVRLGELDASHYAILTSEERGVLFHWDWPLILTRSRR